MRQSDKAKTIAGKVGFIEIGLAELQQIKIDGLRQFHELADQDNLDDHDPFWSYTDDLDKTINKLVVLH